MPYIYKITNKINGKIYIGKTLDTIEKRWKEHCRDYKKPRCEKRPLYDAFNKYGLDNFIIEEVEECNAKELSDREIYWIEFYCSFKNGYNATLGGDGKHYRDYDLILSLYNQGLCIKEIAKKLNYSVDTCSLALKIKGITNEEIKQKSRLAISKTIYQLDKDNHEVINIFPSIQEAYRYLNKQSSGHIAAVCNGKRKTAYGYAWKYGD